MSFVEHVSGFCALGFIASIDTLGVLVLSYLRPVVARTPELPRSEVVAFAVPFLYYRETLFFSLCSAEEEQSTTPDQSM